MMDYQEAIKEAEIQIDMYESMILYNKDFEPKNDNSNYERKMDFLKTVISSMQELHEYHKLGTLEEMKLLKDTHLTGAELAELYCAVKKLNEYKKLGTLEEVREAVEKHEWIPCSEKLPENYDTVLAVTSKNHYAVYVYCKEYGFRTGDIDAEGDVIKWKHLDE